MATRTLLALYLAPFRERREFARSFRARHRDAGLRVVLADDQIEEADRACFDDVVVLPHSGEVGAAVDNVLDHARRAPIDGILIQNEAALLPGTLIAAALSLPGLGIDAAHRCVNKYASRAVLANAGVPVPEYRLAATAPEVKRFAEQGSGFPIVLKPVASVLGRFATRIDRPAEIDAAVARLRAFLPHSLEIARLSAFADRTRIDLGCDPRAQFLVEAFACGDAIETDGIVAAGSIRSFGVSEQVLTSRGGFYIDGYLHPADRTREELAEIERISAAALEASGVHLAGYSVEMRAHRGTATVIEVNPRLGEDDGFSLLFAHAIGGSPLLASAELAMGLEPASLRASADRFALAYRSHFSGGRVVQVPARDRLAREIPGVLGLGVCVEPGALLSAPPSPSFFPHLAYALASDPSSSRVAYSVARRAADGLRFEIVEETS